MAKMHLSVDRIALMRGGRPVLSDLSFSLSDGQALLLRGPNGVGKSSALMVLAGLLPPLAGTLGFSGRDPDARPHEHLHYLGHDTALKPGLTVRENLAFWVDVLGGDRAAIDSALAVVGLGAVASFDAAILSAGQSRRLSLARLIAVPRPLWLLDEPTSALDADGAALVGRLISDHIGAGGLAVVATHLDIAIAGPVETLTFARIAA